MQYSKTILFIPEIFLSGISYSKEITVLLHSRYGIRVAYGGHIFEAIRYLKPQNKNASTKVEKKIIKAVDPHLQLRHSSGEWKAIWWMEDYNLPEKNW